MNERSPAPIPITAQTELSEALAGISELIGVSPSAGTLWSLLWFSAEPLSLEYLAETAGIAKSGASIALRSLVEARLAKRLPRGTDRRSYYVVAASPWSILQHWLRATFMPEVEALLASTAAGADRAEDLDSEVLRDRFAVWKDFLVQTKSALEAAFSYAAAEAATKR
jgi:DNA-binding transcriptional regulator GbsR (MarR family)